MQTPYRWLDIVVMLAWKPLIQLIIISWAKPLVCTSLVKIVMSSAGLTSTLSDSDQQANCKLGIDMYVDQFFYRGGVENQPYDLSYGPKGQPGNP
jgi:hypothetical protein